MGNIIERIMRFFCDGNAITDLLSDIVEEDFATESLLFSVGIEYDGKFRFLNNRIKNWEERELQATSGLSEKYDQIEDCFLGSKTKKLDMVKHCRCIGGGQINFYIYYVFAIQDLKIDPIFLCCAEQAYYDWIVRRLSDILKAVQDLETAPGQEDIQRFHRQIPIKFYEYMQEIYGIDIELILALAGANYERQSCRTNFAFLLEDMDISPLNGVTFDTPVEIKAQNTKKIRKLLQMGKEGQCLLACMSNDTWQIKGLYKESKLPERHITFRLMDHMIWNMEVGKRLAVCYKCGKYIVEGGKFELSKLSKKYKTVFGKNPNTEVKRVFGEAICQKHGTILIIMQRDGEENYGIKDEVDRLLEDSSGMKSEIQELPGRFVESVTTIDGALFIDEYGKCYGFGIILDSNASLKGNPERGARFNSTRKYIKMCQDKKRKALGIVISEDGMVNIFSTDDDFSGEDKNDTKKAKI